MKENKPCLPPTIIVFLLRPERLLSVLCVSTLLCIHQCKKTLPLADALLARWCGAIAYFATEVGRDSRPSGCPSLGCAGLQDEVPEEFFPLPSLPHFLQP